MSTQTKRKYNANFILDTRNYKEPLETLIDRIKSIISATGSEISEVKNEGQKEFTRATDRRFTSGIYLSVDFEGPSEAPATIKEKLRLDRNINRVFITA